MGLRVPNASPRGQGLARRRTWKNPKQSSRPMAGQGWTQRWSERDDLTKHFGMLQVFMGPAEKNPSVNR